MLSILGADCPCPLKCEHREVLGSDVPNSGGIRVDGSVAFMDHGTISCEIRDDHEVEWKMEMPNVERQ